MNFPRLLKDPLIHFLLLGMIVFALFEIQNTEPAQSDVDGSVEQASIVIDEAKIVSYRDDFQRRYNRPPTKVETDKHIQSLIETEVFYREGLKLGLDKNDEQVKLRVAEKMRYLSEDVADIAPPSEQALQQFFAKPSVKASFKTQATVDFEHLFFSPNRTHSREKLIADSAGIIDKLNKGAPPITVVGAARLSSNKYVAAKQSFIAQAFGSESFAEQLFTLPANNIWQGPVASKYGIHIVKISKQVKQNHQPELALVRDEVEKAWLLNKKQAANKAAYAALAKSYNIDIQLPKATSPTTIKNTVKTDESN